MPVGLFMNKIETLHTTSNNQVDQMPPVISNNQPQTIKSHHSADVYFTGHHHHHHHTTNVTISDGDFKYLTKLKNKSEESGQNADDDNAHDLFLDLISGNGDRFENNLDKNMRIDTTLLSPMSIPVDQNNANLMSTSTNNVLIQQITVDNLNSINNNNNNNSTVVEFKNNTSNFTSNNINGDPHINSIPNKLTAHQQATNDTESQITDKSVTNLGEENSYTNASHSEVQYDCSSAEVNISIRNNIDFAIDAVLDKCRSESRNSSEDEEIYELIISKSSSKRSKKSSKSQVEALSIPNEISTDLTSTNNNNSTYSEQVQHIQPIDNSSNSIISSSALTHQHHQQQLLQQQLQAQQPMSKSTKARTSYISSLIANRQKTPTEENCSNIHIAAADTSSSSQQCLSEDEKQKRISQNILTILRNNQLQNSIELSNTSSSINSIDSTINSEMPIVTNQLATPNSDNKKCKKTSSTKPTKPRSSKSKKTLTQTEITSQQPAILTTTSSPSSHEIDFVINSYQQSQQQPEYQQTVQIHQHHAQQQPQLNNNLIYLENQNNLTFYDCDNLKRLLAQPNMDALKLNNEFTSSQQQISSILMQTSTDRVQIKIKQINTDSTINNNNINNNESDSGVVLEPVIDNVPLKESVKRKRTTTKNPTATSRAKKTKTKADVVSEPTVIPVESVVIKASTNNTGLDTINPDQIITFTNTQNSLNLQQQQTQPAPTTQQRTKKLKTIADIVKHNSEAQRNKSLLFLPQPQPQHQPQQPQHQPQQPQQQSLIQNNLIQHPNQYQHQQLHSHQQQQQQPQMRLPHISDTMFNNTDMSSINIDHLLELEFNSVNDPSSVHNHIDKYIDLDDIDLNPLECYRNTNNQATFSQNNPQQTTVVSNQHDDFNFQFSVCSSSSSGFSEPSNFSTCSSQNSYNNNNNLNNSHVLNNSSESESSSPTNKYSNQFDMVRINHNLNHTLNQSNSNLKLNNSCNVINTQFTDWAIEEFTSNVGNGTVLISSNAISGANNQGNVSVNGNCIGNNNNNNNDNNNVVSDMFGGFSFLTD